jgi:mannonate dehydratase
LKIIDIKIIVCCPGRNFVTLKIITDEGVYGVGDATLNGRELAVYSYLKDHMAPCLIGRDASQIEDIWQYFYRGAYWRGGPVGMTALAAVDVALWDIKAKAAGMPLYQMLGGRSRDRVMVYGHANGRDIGETVEQVGKYIDQGYQAIRAQSGIPGTSGTYGVSKNKQPYEPADADLPSEQTWSTARYLDHTPALFERLRDAYGYDQHLLHDVHHRLSPIEACRLGQSLEPYRLFWLEDCVTTQLQDNFRLLRNHTVTPLAVGEVFSSIYDCQQLITEQLIDYIRATIVHAGGITHMRRIASLADLYNVETGFHGATDLSPITMAAALHFDTWVPNFGIQEYMPHTEETFDVFSCNYHFDQGYLTVADQPGHGVDIDEVQAEKYPYQRAYLPVCRLEDGSMSNW